MLFLSDGQMVKECKGRIADPRPALIGNCALVNKSDIVWFSLVASLYIYLDSQSSPEYAQHQISSIATILKTGLIIKQTMFR